MSATVITALRGVGCALLLSTLAACAAAPDRPLSAGALPSNGDWWTRFQNPPLNALVQSGLDRNQPSGGARARLAAEIVDATLTRAACFTKIRVVQDLMEVERQQIDLSPSDSAALRTARQADEATLAALRQDYDRAERRLARLTGGRDDMWTAPHFCLCEIQPPADVGLARRPAAEASAAAARTQAEAIAALDQVSAGYRSGQVPYVRVLAAQARLDRARIAVTEAIAAQSRDTVALFAAPDRGIAAETTPQ